LLLGDALSLGRARRRRAHRGEGCRRLPRWAALTANCLCGCTRPRCPVLGLREGACREPSPPACWQRAPEPAPSRSRPCHRQPAAATAHPASDAGRRASARAHAPCSMPAVCDSCDSCALQRRTRSRSRSHTAARTDMWQLMAFPAAAVLPAVALGLLFLTFGTLYSQRRHPPHGHPSSGPDGRCGTRTSP
jgi:hypothetical protein